MKMDEEMLKRIFFEMDWKTTGDFYLLSALMTIFFNCTRQVATEEVVQFEKDTICNSHLL